MFSVPPPLDLLLLIIIINPTLLQENHQFYGIDWNGPCPCEDVVCAVEVPATECPLSGAQYDELVSTVSPFASSSNHGINLYLATLLFVHEKLS